MKSRVVASVFLSVLWTLSVSSDPLVTLKMRTVGAQALALGGWLTAGSETPEGMFYNPATLAYIRGLVFSAGLRYEAEEARSQILSPGPVVYSSFTDYSYQPDGPHGRRRWQGEGRGLDFLTAAVRRGKLVIAAGYSRPYWTDMKADTALAWKTETIQPQASFTADRLTLAVATAPSQRFYGGFSVNFYSVSSKVARFNRYHYRDSLWQSLSLNWERSEFSGSGYGIELGMMAEILYQVVLGIHWASATTIEGETYSHLYHYSMRNDTVFVDTLYRTELQSQADIGLRFSLGLALGDPKETSLFVGFHCQGGSEPYFYAEPLVYPPLKFSTAEASGLSAGIQQRIFSGLWARLGGYAWKGAMTAGGGVSWRSGWFAIDAAYGRQLSYRSSYSAFRLGVSTNFELPDAGRKGTK